MLRNTILRFFLVLFSALTLNSFAGTIYWVNNGGNWNDAKHWSHNSGGNGGAGIPGINDDVVFDENSFSAPNEQVTITGNAICHGLFWMHDAELATLSGGTLSNLDIYGSVNIEAAINFKYTGTVHFKATQPGNIINMSIGKLTNIYFDGTGSWKLGNLLFASNIYLNSGQLSANGYELACSYLNITGTNPKTLDLKKSTLYVENLLNEQNSGNLQLDTTNTKIYFERHRVNSFSAALHNTRRVFSVDSSHTKQTNLTCNYQDSLGGATHVCNGVAWIDTVYSPDSGPFSYTWGNGDSTDTATALCAGSQSYQVYDASDGSLSAPSFVTITEPNQLLISYSVRQPVCSGSCNGWYHYYVTGGTPSYSFSWTNGGPKGTTPGGITHYLYDSSLCVLPISSPYKIHIADSKGCHNIVKPNPITATAAVTVTATFTPPTCSNSCDATATATPKGGHGTIYTYKWNPTGQTTKTATGLCAGTTYTVTAYDDSLCSATATVAIVGPPVVNVSINPPTNVTCFGLCNGSATVVASGGVGSFTYLWNTTPAQTGATATGLCAGTYKVIATDTHGCKDSANVTITQPNPLIGTLGTTNNPLLCNGTCNASASVSVSGGTAPYTYSWNTVNTNAAINNLCAGTYIVDITDAQGCTTADTVGITQPSPLIVNVKSAVNPSCNGTCNGSIKITVSGGSTPYSYNWAPIGNTTKNINGLCDGTYTLTVTDANGCTDNSTVVTLTQPNVLNVSMTIDQVSCNGSCDGKAFAGVTGGTTPYTYAWNTTPTSTIDSATGLCAAANDSVKVVDANLCNTTIYYTVTQPTPLSSSILANNTSCTTCNGSATVSASGGTSPYIYKWNTVPEQTTASATSLCPGNYTVSITDADSCKITQSVTIVPTVTIVVTSSASGLSCNGSCDGTATANASGGTPPYSYLWSCVPAQTTSTATGLCAGTYTVHVHDVAGCTNTDSVLFVNPPVLSGITAQTNVSCNATCVGTASLTASGGTPPYSYAWSNGETTSSVSGLCQGTYTIKLIDANLCNVTYTITITQAPPLAANPVVVTPVCNTSTGSITLSPTGGIGPYTFSWKPGTATGQDTSGLAAGTYSVTITDTKGCTNMFLIPVNNTTGPVLTSLKRNNTCWNNCNGYDSVGVVSGSPGYTFTWSSGQATTAISNLCPGIYICTVKDAIGCITNNSDTITSPKKLQPNAVAVNVDCNGAGDGSISLAPTGGTGSYSYTWSPAVSTTNSAASLSPNTYTITITDGNTCDTTINITITQPPALTLSMASTNVLCNGACNGTGTGHVGGGTKPYIYTWSNAGVDSNIVNLCPGGYTLNVTDGNGCPATGNVSIIQPAVLSGTISGTNVSCNSGSDGTAQILVSGGTTNYAYSWTGGYTSSAIGPVSSGTYVVTVTDANLCTITNSITITQPNPISIVITPVNVSCATFCNGTASAVVNGGTGGYSYAWTGGATTSSVSALCPGTYTLNVTDANSCPASDQVTISQPLPLLANVTSTDTKCPTSCDGTATSNTLGGTSPYTYVWNGGATTSAVTNLCAGNDTVIVVDGNSCIDTGYATITNPTAITTSVATAQSSCNVCNGSITVTAAGGTAGYTYTWGTLPPGSSQVNVCAGIYTYTVTDANSCTANFTTILNNASGPTGATVTTSNDSCFNLCDGQISAAPIGGTSPFTYSFNGSAPQNSDTGTNLCAGSYTVTITDNLGCKLYDTASLTQPTLLVNTGITTNATCVGICNGTIALTTSGGTPPYNYSWSNGQSTSTMSGLCPGIYTVTVTDGDLCSLIQTYTVGQNVIVTSSITPTLILCYDSCTGAAIENASGGLGPYTYLWSNTSTSSNISALCVGKYAITVTDQNGCEALDTANITQPTEMQATFKNTLISCNGSCDGTITASVTGGASGYLYNWSNSETTDSIGSLCSGTYTLTITDNNGCMYDTTSTLNNPPVLSVKDTVTNPTCNTTSNGVITVTASGGVQPYYYSWSTSATDTSPSITNLLPGTYIVSITDSTNCNLIDKITIVADTTVIAKPGNDTSVCQTFPATLNGSASINASTYAWYALPSKTLVGSTSIVTVTPTVTTQYILVATDGICVDTSAIINVNVNPPPIVNTGGSQSIFLSASATLGGSPTSGVGDTYMWQPYTAISDSVSANPIVSPTVTTTYTVTVTSPFGCITIDTVTVNVLPKFIPPGGFTPNGDGVNDYWDLNVSKFPNVSVEVFNRWGERIFHSIGYKIPWDGTYNHEPVPVGTYYYVINLNDPLFPNAITGPVTIMR